MLKHLTIHVIFVATLLRILLVDCRVKVEINIISNYMMHFISCLNIFYKAISYILRIPPWFTETVLYDIRDTVLRISILLMHRDEKGFREYKYADKLALKWQKFGVTLSNLEGLVQMLRAINFLQAISLIWVRNFLHKTDWLFTEFMRHQTTSRKNW